MTRPVVAVIGGGQLARMMAPAAARLGIELRALVEAADGSAAQVLPFSTVGSPQDHAAVEALIQGADVLTFEHEHIPPALLESLVSRGVAVHPGPHALLYAQDKIEMRRRLTELSIPCPKWRALNPFDAGEAAQELTHFLTDLGGDGTASGIVKTARGGYDGKGVKVVSAAHDVAEWLEAATRGGPQLLAEEKVPFARELAVLVARSSTGEVRTWPVVESIQVDGVCSEVIAPAPDLSPELAAQARGIAVRIAEGLDVTGVLAVEMFHVPDAAAPLLVNELAMRPHNSGHWTIDGSVTSQFEQHIRAVLGLPLGDTSARAPWTVMVNVLGSTLEDPTDALPELLAADPAARVELYGKEVRPGRKLGHVNVSGTDLTETRTRAQAAATRLMAP